MLQLFYFKIQWSSILDVCLIEICKLWYKKLSLHTPYAGSCIKIQWLDWLESKIELYNLSKIYLCIVIQY